MTQDNPFDLVETSKKYKWGTENKTLQIVIDVLGVDKTNSMYAYNQLFCWMRDHFVKITKLEMLGGEEDKIKAAQEEFQNTWYKVIRYEEVPTLLKPIEPAHMEDSND